MENPSKPWWQSKTVIGAGVTVAASLLHATGLPLTDVDTASIVDAVVTIVGAVGGLVAIFGRLVAKSSLH